MNYFGGCDVYHLFISHLLMDKTRITNPKEPIIIMKKVCLGSDSWLKKLRKKSNIIYLVN